MNNAFVCVQCSVNSTFTLESNYGEWSAVCTGCDTEYILFPNGTAQLVCVGEEPSR